MPLQRNLVEAGKNESGKQVIFCAHCHKQAVLTDPTNNQDATLIYELICPTPAPVRILGSWDDEKQRADDIKEFFEGNDIKEHIEEKQRQRRPVT